MPVPEQILEALKKVKFPGLSRDIVSFGFVRDIRVEGGVVSLTIHFQTENPAVGQQIAPERFQLNDFFADDASGTGVVLLDALSHADHQVRQSRRTLGILRSSFRGRQDGRDHGHSAEE